MVRFRKLILLAAVALGPAAGCMTTKPLTTQKLNETIKDALPQSVLAVGPKAAPATEFATAWQTKLGHLPDPTRNGAMSPGIVGQAFLYTEKLAAAEIAGSLTIVANDATPRPAGMPPKQPNVWHFDADTLKRMVVNDDRFGKSLAIFLPWPEEWADVNRLLIQARYDQPAAPPLFASQSTVTLDLFTSGPQVNVSQSRQTLAQMAVPDPKALLQQAQANPAARTVTGTGQPFPAVANPIVPVNNQGVPNIGQIVPVNHQAPAAAWPNVGTPPAGQPQPSVGGMPVFLQQQGAVGILPTAGPQPPANVVGTPLPPFQTNPPLTQPAGEFQRTVIPRN
jgi:hypothetical protein